MKTSTLSPIHFDFQKNWPEVRSMEDRPALKREFEKILRKWQDIADFAYQETRAHDEAQATAEYRLRLHEGQVMHRDLHWLREKFESIDLYDLAIAIAEELYPDAQWDIYENQNGSHAIVSAPDQTLIFDLKYSNTLTAGASAYYAEHPTFKPSEAAIKEVQAFYGGRLKELNEVLAKLKSLTESKEGNATILPFEK